MDKLQALFREWSNPMVMGWKRIKRQLQYEPPRGSRHPEWTTIWPTKKPQN